MAGRTNGVKRVACLKDELDSLFGLERSSSDGCDETVATGVSSKRHKTALLPPEHSAIAQRQTQLVDTDASTDYTRGLSPTKAPTARANASRSKLPAPTASLVAFPSSQPKSRLFGLAPYVAPPPSPTFDIRPYVPPAPAAFELRPYVPPPPPLSPLIPYVPPPPVTSGLRPYVPPPPPVSALKPYVPPPPPVSALRPYVSPPPVASVLKPYVSPPPQTQICAAPSGGGAPAAARTSRFATGGAAAKESDDPACERRPLLLKSTSECTVRRSRRPLQPCVTRGSQSYTPLPAAPLFAFKPYVAPPTPKPLSALRPYVPAAKTTPYVALRRGAPGDNAADGAASGPGGDSTEGREQRRARRHSKNDERRQRRAFRAQRREIATARSLAAPAPHQINYGFARSTYCVNPARLPCYSETRLHSAAVADSKCEETGVAGPINGAARPAARVAQAAASPAKGDDGGGRRWAPYNPVVSRLRPALRDFIRRCVEVSEERRREISMYEQGSEQWKEGRRHRMGGSNYSAAAGDNPYTSENELIQEMISPTFAGNDATRRGTEKEPYARRALLVQERAAFMRAMKKARAAGLSAVRYANRMFEIPENVDALAPDDVYNIVERGARISPSCSWISSSTDGDIHIFGKKVGIVEIKTPQTNRAYPNTPSYYFAQIQGNMHVHEVGFCLFVCYVENEDDARSGRVAPLHVELFEYDRDYCEHYLFPRIHRFYLRRYVPAFLEWDRIRESGSDADRFLQQFAPPAILKSKAHGYDRYKHAAATPHFSARSGDDDYDNVHQSFGFTNRGANAGGGLLNDY